MRGRTGCPSPTGARSGGKNLGAAPTQGGMERSSLRQPPLAHRGDVDAVLVAGVAVHGVRPVPFDGGSPEHWQGERKGCWSCGGTALPATRSWLCTPVLGWPGSGGGMCPLARLQTSLHPRRRVSASVCGQPPGRAWLLLPSKAEVPEFLFSSASMTSSTQNTQFSIRRQDTKGRAHHTSLPGT